MKSLTVSTTVVREITIDWFDLWRWKKIIERWYVSIQNRQRVLVECKIECARDLFFPSRRSASRAMTWEKIDISGYAKRKFGTAFHPAFAIRFTCTRVTNRQPRDYFYIDTHFLYSKFNLLNEHMSTHSNAFPAASFFLRILMRVCIMSWNWRKNCFFFCFCFMQNAFLYDEN
jgi:hypothetical protein